MDFGTIGMSGAELTQYLGNSDLLYESVSRYIMEHFVLYWTIVVGAFGVIGIALYFIAKGAIASGIKKGTAQVESRVKKLENAQRTLLNQLSNVTTMQNERGTWTPAFDNLKCSESSGKYFCNGDQYIISAVLRFDSLDGEQSKSTVNITQLPFPITKDSSVIIGNAIIDCPNCEMQCFDVIAGYGCIMLVSNSGYLRASDIKNGAKLTFSAILPKPNN